MPLRSMNNHKLVQILLELTKFTIFFFANLVNGGEYGIEFMLTTTPTLLRRVRQKCHSNEISEKEAATRTENSTHREIPIRASTLRGPITSKKRSSNGISEKELSVKDKESETTLISKRVGISIDEEIPSATSGSTKAIHSDITTDKGIQPTNNSLEFFQEDVCFFGQSCQNKQTEPADRCQFEQSLTAQEMETFELFSATMGSISTLQSDDTEESQ